MTHGAFLLRLALVCAALSLASAEGTEEPDQVLSALADDDTCLAGEACALNAMQLRGRSVQKMELTAKDPEDWFKQLEKMLDGPGAQTEGIDERNHWDLAYQFAGNEFDVVHVANDEVEARLPYARPGSDIPAGFHGVFWLDQRHASSIAKSSSYESSKPFTHPASDEAVVSFGDYPIGYNKQTNCVGPVPNYGGERGHWTFLSTPGGRLQMRGSIKSRLTVDFCFNEAMDKVEVQAAVLVPLLNLWIFPPSWMFVMRMWKTSWGWDRVTTVGPNITSILAKHRSILEKVFPPQVMAILDIGNNGAFHYPFLQIVTGDGQRTKYYDEYLAWISGEANDHHKTQVLGVIAQPRCDGFLFGTVSRRRRFGKMCSCRRRTTKQGPEPSSDGSEQWRCVGNEMEHAGKLG